MQGIKRANQKKAKKQKFRGFREKQIDLVGKNQRNLCNLWEKRKKQRVKKLTNN